MQPSDGRHQHRELRFRRGVSHGRGSYPSSLSPYGTLDQGGNVYEWNETATGSAFRGIRGGSLSSLLSVLAAANGQSTFATAEQTNIGFRVAAPEPGASLVGTASLLALLSLGRGREPHADERG